MLGEMLANGGRGGPRDHQAALSLFEKATEQGHAGAMFALGASRAILFNRVCRLRSHS
jgi:uncharacterized protein